MPHVKPASHKAIKEAVVVRLRQVLGLYDFIPRQLTAEQKLSLATVEQAIHDIGAHETHWDRGTEENPDSSAAWLDGRMTPYCQAAGLEVEWVIRVLRGVGLL